MSLSRYCVAVAQMNSGPDWEENLAQAEAFAAEAAQKGAKLLAFPETMNYMSRDHRLHAEPIPGPTTQLLCTLAKRHGLWIHGGSITEAAPENMTRNTTVLISPAGEIVCSYSKMHLFDVDLPHGTAYRESSYTLGGDHLTVARTPLGTMGLSICFDLRYCELYRLLTLAGAQILFVPASFTMNTGYGHWEPLLRARAIENACYVIAPDQVGKKASMLAYGKSMIVDPWGNVVAQASDRPGLIVAEIDLELVESVRQQIPSLQNRRADLYRLEAERLQIVDAL